MKVKIGPYKNWVGPYQIAEALCFWAKPVKDEYGFERKPDWVHDFGTWLAERKDGSDTWLTKLCQWVESKRKRSIHIHIDKYDTWSMDHTLGLIVLPMLKQLQATKHGAPLVDDEDVPEYLRSTAAPAKANDWDTDDNHFKRWDWVLDEMIQAFECKVSDDWDAQYWSGSADWKWKPTDRDGNPVPEGEKPKFYELEHGPKHTQQCDWDALKAHQQRNDNGFRLFGKYFQALWD